MLRLTSNRGNLGRHINEKTFNTRDSLLVTDLTTDLALLLKAYLFGEEGSGVSGPENGRLFSSVSAVRLRSSS